MNAVAIAVIAVTALVFVYVRSYNRLANDREIVDDSWAAVDAELARQHELIPGLVQAVNASGVSEPRMLDELIRAERAAAGAENTASARSVPEHDLAGAAAAVVALREQYPVLDGDRTFRRSQHDLAITGQRIGAARHHYNDRAADLNRRIRAFPSSLVARVHGFTAAAPFDD